MATPKAISKFFLELGFKLRNVQWSWGARNGDSILLRTWQDEYDGREKRVVVLDPPGEYVARDSFGLDERIGHLKSLWLGEAAGYTVIMEAVDTKANPRKIKGYRDDVVWVISHLELRADNSIVAVLSGLIPVGELQAHLRTHRTAPAVGPFPVDDAERTGVSTDGYQQKIPAIRSWLIGVCRERGTVTYSDVMQRFGLTFYPLRNAMGRLGHDCKAAGEPIITALIVDKETGLCSDGLAAEFDVADDAQERERCYAHWGEGQPDAEPLTSPVVMPPTEDDDLAERAKRFAQVEVRPDQQAFRKAVFMACGGACVVSGCDVPEALDAAHLDGRDWRQGHNTAADGILLRKDLHALYDRGLLRLANGRVELDASTRPHYADLNGATARVPHSGTR